MADRLSALVVCPGRGTYGKNELGYLGRHHNRHRDLIERFDSIRAERAPELPCRRITAEDSFIPLGRAATLTLPSRDSIVEAALELVRG